MNGLHWTSDANFTFCLKQKKFLGEAIDPLKLPSFEGISLEVRLLSD